MSWDTRPPTVRRAAISFSIERPTAVGNALRFEYSVVRVRTHTVCVHACTRWCTYTCTYIRIHVCDTAIALARAYGVQRCRLNENLRVRRLPREKGILTDHWTVQDPHKSWLELRSFSGVILQFQPSFDIIAWHTRYEYYACDMSQSDSNSRTWTILYYLLCVSITIEISKRDVKKYKTKSCTISFRENKEHGLDRLIQTTDSGKQIWKIILKSRACCRYI